MPRFIIKLTDQNNNEYYMLWSTIVDAPISKGLCLQDFEKFYQEEYGNQGMVDFHKLMEIVQSKNTSSRIDADAEETIRFNQAGPGRSPLSMEEIVRFYCLDEIPNNDHPCWKERLEAMNSFYRENGGMNDEDMITIINKFPYNREK